MTLIVGDVCCDAFLIPSQTAQVFFDRLPVMVYKIFLSLR